MVGLDVWLWGQGWCLRCRGGGQAVAAEILGLEAARLAGGGSRDEVASLCGRLRLPADN